MAGALANSMQRPSLSREGLNTDGERVHSICMKLGRRVRALRQERGWSQETLAQQSGLHPSYIGGIERGQRNPSLLVVAQLATAFGLSPAQPLQVPEQAQSPSSIPGVAADEHRLLATMAFFLSACVSCEKFHQFRRTLSRNTAHPG